MTVSQHASCKNGHLFYFLEKKMKEKIPNLINKEPIAKLKYHSEIIGL
jgi:hypothetical protein